MARKKKNKKMSRLAVCIAVFCLLLAAAGFLYTNRYRFASNIPKTTAIFEYEGSRSYQFGHYKNDFLALNTEGVTEMNSSGRQVNQIPFRAAEPSMEVNGNFVLLYDRNGKSLASYKGKTKLADLTTESEIILAKINSTGYIGLVTREKGYKCKVQILNQYGELVYQWLLAENYVVDLDISPDCRYFAAATISTAEKRVDGDLVFVDITNEKIMAQTQREDSLILAVRYSRGNTLTAICEDAVLGFDASGTQKWENSFGGKKLKTYSMEPNSNLVICLSGSDNSSTVISYARTGKMVGEYTTPQEVKTIATRGNSIAVAEFKDVVLLGQNGREKERLPVEKDIKQIILTTDRMLYAGGNSVNVVR